jgi:hypothetical protein
MIDWARRRINLAQSSELPERDWPLITRDVLWRALLPHTIKSIAAADSAADDGAMDGEGRVGEFTKLEVMLRDTFDTFLDGLERFASFVDSRLVTADEFRPYLAYWIDDLATDQGDSDDARWRCVLLTYIHFYRFDGVVRIFNALGHDVRLDGPIFQELRSRMKDDELYARLLQSATDGLYGASAIATSTPQWRLAQPANAIRR